MTYDKGAAWYVGTEIVMNRHHFLASREPEDMMALVKAKITDDFTMGYADVAGFRLGTCRPVQWFDSVQKRLTNLTLHPLTVMDCTLDRPEYMNLGYESALTKCRGLLHEVAMHSGEAVLLWHNSELTVDRQKAGGYHKKLYRQLLADMKINHHQDVKS